jgi:hypothetical protein
MIQINKPLHPPCRTFGRAGVNICIFLLKIFKTFYLMISNRKNRLPTVFGDLKLIKK